MNKHTSVKPTPFKIEPTIFHIHQPDPRGKDWYDLFGKDFYVGRIIDEQNAAYIVKAVNSHERYKAIAQSIIDESKDGLDRSVWRLSEALKLAGEE